MKLSIAIPDSSLKDEKKHENKTRKIFLILSLLIKLIFFMRDDVFNFSVKQKITK